MANLAVSFKQIPAQPYGQAGILIYCNGDLAQIKKAPELTRALPMETYSVGT
jgi:hypothetical protein